MNKIKYIKCRLTFEKLKIAKGTLNVQKYDPTGFSKFGIFANNLRNYVTSNGGEESKSYSVITTPIFYVNSRPHIGHLYTAVIADAYHRFQKLKYGNMLGDNAYLFTGTDEHGMKIEKAAKLGGCKTVIEHCDSVSQEFRKMCDDFNINYNEFIRTTEIRHKDAVTQFWSRLQAKGHIYKGQYEGWYCESEEAFVPESQVTDKADGSKTKISVESGNPVEWVSEENYMFRLSSQMQNVIHWIKHANPVVPEKFNSILLHTAQQDMQDISVSRPKSRLTWGIPVPGDPSQMIYVWLDALTNYLTVSGYPNNLKVWPPTLQLVGKDILKFHGIYWPAFLMAAGLEPPKKIFCHSHWIVDNKKMSKSLGNVIDPSLMSQKYGKDGLRYFLLREGTPHADANFNEEKMRRYLNAELADTLGNLLNRCTAKAINPSQTWPSATAVNEEEVSPHGKNLIASLEELVEKVAESYETLNFYRGIDHILTTIRLANLFVEEEKPWVLAKLSPENPQLINMLNLIFETLRVTTIMMQPIIPNLSTLALDRLNISTDERCWTNIRPFLWDLDLKTESRQLGEFKSVFYSRLQR